MQFLILGGYFNILLSYSTKKAPCYAQSLDHSFKTEH
jgi:hypothetical protein